MAYSEAVSRSPPAPPKLVKHDSHKQPSNAAQIGPEQPKDDERPIWIYVDDSNIWIMAKQLAAKKLKTKEDHRVRIDVGKLTDVVARGRPVAQGFVYGSEPPPVDSVWEKIKECGWSVPPPKRRSMVTGKEKGVDAQLVADITEKACTTLLEDRTTIVIISGDADVMPAIRVVLRYPGWKVEVCMWENALSSDLKRLPQKEQNVQVHYLDKFLERITFTNMKFSARSLRSCEKATSVVLRMKPKAFPGRVPTRKWCQQLESITQWPFQYYWVHWKGSATDDLVLVFRKDSRIEFDAAGFLSQLEEYPIARTIKAQPYVQYEQEKSGLYQMALEKVGYISYDDACDGYDNEAISMSDDECKPWRLARKSPPPVSQRYSERCAFKVNCKFGLKCFNKHTDDEKEFFKANQGQGNPLRKVKPCAFYPNCKKGIKDCFYAHGQEDAWCLNCRDMCGHYTTDCPQLKKCTEDF